MARKNESAAIQDAGRKWQEANKRGDKAGMDAAHKEAERLRAQEGYSGGSDGSQRIPTSNGGNRGNSSSGGGKRGSSSGFGKVDPYAPAQNKNTNASYDGKYLTVDLNTDYTALQNDAASKGDYTAAAKYEALRNAKVNYLNSTGDNRYSISNDYVRDSGQRNSQGGSVFYGGLDNLGVLPENWMDATVGGSRYVRDGNGRIYKVDNTLDDGTGGTRQFVGSGINAQTGEFTFDNQEDARRAAYNNYIRSNGLGVYGDGAYDYIDKNGLVDQGYIDAVQGGNGAEYAQALAEQRRKEREELERRLSAYQEMEDEYRNPQPGYDDYHANNFAPNPNAAAAGLDNEDYLQALIDIFNSGNRRVY